MLRARLSNGVFVLGIDAENVKRLKEGKAIMVSLGQLGGTDDVVIMYGETVDAIAQELQRASGEPLPPAQPLPRGH